MSMAEAAVFAPPLFLSVTACAQQPPHQPALAPLALRWVAGAIAKIGIR
jgi:hypothetical protein